jgi:two-component system, NarL family, captular synthesis response regulator RcsB
MNTKTRVVVADDHPAVRRGICVWLERDLDIEVVATAADSHSLAELIDRIACDVVISDIGMRGMNGESNSIAFLRRLARRAPRPRIVVVTMIAQRQMAAGLLQLGVDGIVDKRDGMPSLSRAVRAVMNGERFVSSQVSETLGDRLFDMPARAGVLSACEWQVLQLYAAGLAVPLIARRLGRSSKTIGTQKRNGMRKLGLASEAELIAYLQQIGLT